MDVGHECLEVFVVNVNRVEKLKESFYYLNVGLSEVFIKFNKINVVLNLHIV
jgi:hypothetical protein